MSKKDSIIVIGANGQIGSVLVPALRHSFGNDNVLATDLKKPVIDNGRFEILDALDAQRLAELVDQYKVTQIYLLAEAVRQIRKHMLAFMLDGVLVVLDGCAFFDLFD